MNTTVILTGRLPKRVMYKRTDAEYTILKMHVCIYTYKYVYVCLRTILNTTHVKIKIIMNLKVNLELFGQIKRNITEKELYEMKSSNSIWICLCH